MASSSMKIDGLISGINTTDLINSLMAAERAPVNKLEEKLKIRQFQKQGLLEINTSLLSFQSQVSALSLVSTFKAKKVSSSDEAVATATSRTDAPKGSYKLDVLKMATASQSTSSGAVGLGAATAATLASSADINTVTGTVNPNGKFNATGLPGDPMANFAPGVKVVAGSFKINGVQIDVAGDDTVNTVINKINNSKAGVTAKLENNRFVLTQNTTGSSPTITLTNDTSGFFTAVKVSGVNATAGTDAGQSTKLGQLGFNSGFFTINGVAFSVDAKNETLDDIIKKVNNSKAGVSMSYDAKTDKVIISNTDLGNRSLTIGSSTDTSNFLEKLRLETGSASTGGLRKAVSGATAWDAQKSTKLTDLNSNGATLGFAAGQKFKLTINGKDTAEIDNTLGDMTINDVLNAINDIAGSTNVLASLDTSQDGNIKIKLTSTEPAGTITVADSGGYASLAGTLGLNVTAAASPVSSIGDLETPFTSATATIATKLTDLYKGNPPVSGGLEKTKFKLKVSIDGSTYTELAVIDNTKGDKTLQDVINTINASSADTKIQASIDMSGGTAKLKLARTDGGTGIYVDDVIDAANGVNGTLFQNLGFADANPADSSIATPDQLLDFAPTNLPDADENTQLSNLSGGLGTNLVGSFTFKILKDGGDPTVPTDYVSIDFDNSDGSKKISDFLAAINAIKDDTGVTASLDTGAAGDVKIKLTHKDGKTVDIQDVTGSLINKLGISAMGDFAQGVDAEVKINDVAYTQQGNSFEMYGTTFNIKKLGTANISVNYDIDSIVTAVEGFVKAYNDTMKLLRDKINEKKPTDANGRVRDAQNDDELKLGIMKEFSFLREAESTLRRLATSKVAGLPDELNSLSQIGVTSGKISTSLSKPEDVTAALDAAKQGLLYLDKEQLKKKLNENLEGVMNIFKVNTKEVTDESLNSGSIIDAQGSTKLADLTGSTFDLKAGQKYKLSIKGANAVAIDTDEIDNTSGDKSLNDIVNAINKYSDTTKVIAILENSAGGMRIKLSRTDDNSANPGITIGDVSGYNLLTGAGKLLAQTTTASPTYYSTDPLKTKIVTDNRNIANGTNKNFYLAHKNVTRSMPYSLEVNGVTYTRVEGNPSTDLFKNEYSINFETGQITFGVAPPDGAQIKMSYSYDLGDEPEAGIITRQKSYLMQLTRIGGTISKYTTDQNGSIDKEVSSIAKQIASYEDRLAMREKSLWNQYTAMETALSKMKNQSAAFAQQLGQLSSSSS